MNIIHRPTSTDSYSLSLKKIADELLSPQAGDDSLKEAAAGLYSLCSSLTGIDEYSLHADDAERTRLPSGEAISPRDAAGCLLDYSRTSKFLRGLSAAIRETQKRFPNTAIEILYAGCGPFAPLAVPLTTRFNSAEINFTLLDVHRRSLDAARHIFQALGKSAFVRDYIQCDAASYRHIAPHVIHVVVVEAMQAALEREPQVAITMNLAPQLCAGGIFLPERITIDGCLCDPTKEFPTLPAEAVAADSLPGGDRDRVRINLGRVLELTAGNCRNLSAAGNRDAHGATSLAPKLLKVSEEVNGEFYLMLLTAIDIFGSIALADNESGLTCPKVLYDAGKVRGGQAIEFEYHLGEKPGFKYRRCER
ncbi:MAG TPA: hypothetical protein VEZ40_11140 [Pyrinomonadaceae bacterium]|nr:hypothetical protein [Pyrinomonadaceae bacterium]